ncbi:autotransporter-associated beta strand repeat-containing protein [Prosthecobacter sp.]|uniref:autotransporter-associated beta strand repeat-containing protein n=1 Tax=Prosthecobacter sp. TaxID=1965333 RepID=UPI001D6F413E|nr:autotransporter-associated beta strand repeat-containing protein [Prosthecobacter sp.]MCB1278191.1 autotransporter-associated beta strand repeat-containing protein [Prosthecobacter sp.]
MLLLLLTLFTGVFSTQTQAATFYWDADADATGNLVDGTNVGGTGTWDTITGSWWDGVSADVAWPNSLTDTAIFSGTAGTVTLGGPINAGTLIINSTGYLLTGSTLTLGGAATIDVSGLNDVRIDSDIAGSLGLIKTGNGTLNLGSSNSYTGNTTINGGIVEVYKDESLGTGGGNVVLDGGTLRALGNNFYSTRGITIGAGGGTLDVTRNNSTFGSMRLKGEISGAGTLTKTGFGELRLDGDSSAFTGDFILDSGIVRMQAYTDRGTVTNIPSLSGASSYTIRSGGDLIVAYNAIGSTPYYSAVNETAPVHMEGGRIQFYSNSSGAVSPWTQTMGDLFLDRGSSRFFISRTSSSSATLWSFGDLTRSVGATADFDWTTSAGTLGDPGNNPRIVFNSIPDAVNDGILGGWALVNQINFATYDATNGVAIANYTSTDLATAGAADNVDFSQGAVTTTIGDTTVNALKWTATAGVTSGTPTTIIEQTNGSTLTIDTGGLLAIGNFYKSIQPESGGNATITANGGALYVHNAQLNLYIYSTIADGDMATALVKTQAGNLVIYSNTDNTYSGGTFINGAGNVYTGTVDNRTYLGTGPVYVTRGILNVRRMGATTSTEGYSVFEGGSIYLDSSTTVFNTPGDRFTVDGTSSFGGQSTSAGGGGLNSLTYVAGAVSAGGEVHLDPGATVLHGTNSSAMGTGNNTIQNLPNDMQFYFGDGTTQTAGSGVTIGVGTPWKGIGNDRNTRAWDLGTIMVNGSDFELHAMLVPNQNGEGQSAYTLRLGNGTGAGGPVITGAASTPLTAHVTGGYVGLDDSSATYGSIAAGSPVTFMVEPGGTLEVSQSDAMGSGDGLASIIVLDGGTLQQYGSTDAARLAAAATGLNGDVTVQSRGRFLAQNTNGLSGTGQLTFEARSIIQINNNTGWTGAQALAAIGVNDAIVKINVDNFGTAAQPLLTTYFDGTGIYEWSANANAANPTSAGTPIVSLDGAPGSGHGIIINDAFDRSLDATSRGFIELKPGGAGGTIASSSGHLFNINEDVELNGLTLTIGYADVIDGDPGLGDVRMDKVTDSVGGGSINVISGAQLRISATDAIDNSIFVTLQAGAWLDVDNNDTILSVTGGGVTSRILGDATLTVTQAGDYDLGASIGDTANLLQTGGGILTLDQDSDGGGNLAVSNGTIRIGTGVSIGSTFNLNPTSGGVIDLNGTTNAVRSITGNSTGTIELNGGVLVFANSGTVTIDSGEAVINGPGTIRLIGEGQVRFNQDPSRMTNISQIDVFNGEFRVDGIAGTPNTFLINAPVINLGDGFVTTGGTGFQVFPRLYLVNTETTQTAELNVNGGWITSDLGNGDLTIWSGDINFTGTGNTNLFDVNDAGVGDQHEVTGVIGGTGGFSKINTGTLRLVANNTISGDIYIQRNGVGGSNIDSTLSRGGIRLTGPDGALSSVNSMVISRDGSFYLFNATDVNNDRVNDTADLILRGQGRIRLVGNAGSAVSETMGDLIIESGSGKINFDLDDATPQTTSFTFASFQRDPGSIAQFQVLDNVLGSFGTTAHLFIQDGGASATLYGGGTGNGTTTQSIVLGAFGGVNNISNHFMTFDSLNTTELRPLDFDTEYLQSSSLPVKGLVDGDYTVLYGVNQNFMLNYNVDRAGDPDGDVNWYGDNPNRVTTNVAMNSLRFGTNTPTSTVNSNNNNELGSVLVLNADVTLYLGDSLGATNGVGFDTNGSGMLLFGRDVSGTSAGSNQYIAGGVLDFGTREAIIVNESGNSALIRSEIAGSGGLTKAGAQTVYFDNSNSYTGVTTIAEGILVIRDQHGLGDSNLLRIENDGRLYLELGTNMLDSASGGAPANLYIGNISVSTNVLHSNSANNTWGGDIIVDTVDDAGNWVFTPYLGTGALYTLTIDGDIYGNEEGGPGGIAANHINTDTALNDARLIATNSINSAGGVINLNGQFHDNQFGAIAAPVTSDNENQLLRFFIRGSDQAVVNARQQWDAAGLIFVENGILRYEGDGNFWTPLAAANMNSANGQSGMRIGGNSNNWNAAVILTKPGQALNISRIDIGGDGNNDFNQFGNDMLAGTNTSGTVTFGDGTDRVVYNGSSAANNFVRDLTVYQAGGGTMELNFRLDDTDADSHTSFTKIGRGVVNFNGQNDVNGAAQNGDVEQLNMSGGLLRLTNYGNATGRRFDTGAMITFAGGGIEMDGASSIQNETANYTGAAVGTASHFPTAQTLISAGGTDVIVTSKEGRITTMNIGSTTLATNRLSGGTLNFVENGAGGTSVITFRGSGGGSIQADDTAYAWATYGDSYTYNAAAATYTLNALDFAMTTGGSGDITQFAGATRQDEDDVTLWTAAMDVSENGAGFNGGVAASPVNTLHFDFDGTGIIDATNGLEVTNGGIMISSTVLTGAKSIINGTLMAGADADLIIHQYGGAAMTIGSIIADNGGSAAGNALVKTGSGELILAGSNTFTGRTFLNGGALTISSDANLGVAPGAALVDAIYINGGNLNTTADFTLDANRGIMLGGNGGQVNVASGTTLSYGGIIASEPNVIVNYSANPAVGRIDKTGDGTLYLTNINNTYNGLTEIKAGTVKWEPTFSSSTTATPFGSNSAFLDGTILRSGATLVLAPQTPANNSNYNAFLQEWFTFEGGSVLDLAPVNTAGDPHDINFYFRGILQFDSLGNAGTPDGVQTAGTLAGATTIKVGSQGTTNLNDAGGYITGDGGITKIGPGTMYFRESNPEWTGQLIVSEGSVNVFSAGNPLGVGTMPIILGHNLAAETAGEEVTGNSTVQLLYRDEGGYRDVSNVSQAIIVRDDSGAGNQTKRIGAVYLAHADVVNYNGTLTLQDDVEFYYQDDVRNSTTPTNTSNTRNDTRSIGAPTNAETVFINFNGNIVGSKNISINVPQGGSGNVANGSILDPFDDFVINAIFGLNGDNTGWTGDLLITNNSATTGGSDVDRIAIVRLGNAMALNDNLVKFASQGHLQLAGINKTFTQDFLFVGATGVATTAKIENAAFTDVTLTFSADGTRTGVSFQDIGVGMDDGLVFGGTLSNQGLLNVVKTGIGETVFGASTGGDDIADAFSSYSGTTTVLQGTLYAGSNNSFSPYSRFIVSDGALLSPYWDNAGAGFDVTIGSLSGESGSTVNIENSTLRIGGDNTNDADFAGVIQTNALGAPGAGANGFYKIGSGSQRLSGDNTFVTTNLAVRQGTLIGGSNTAFGDAFNVINLGGIVFSESPKDVEVELLLDGTANAVVNQVQMNNFDGNDEGITVIGTRATSGTYGFATGGTVSLYQDISTNVFVEADGSSIFQFGDVILDGGFGGVTPLVKVGSGTVEFHTANSYNSGGAWAAGTAIDGGTVVRHGTLSVFDNDSLSTTIVELGDIRRNLASDAYLATTRSLIAAATGGSFDGSSDGAGGAGNGAFLNVTTIVDGVTITTADIGKRILVKDEGESPERNGVYEIVSLDPNGTHMNLVRADDFDETTEMLYGTSIGVTTGAQAGTRFFMASADVNIVNGVDDGFGNTEDPVLWLVDLNNPDVGLVAGASGLIISTDIDINDTNGTGSTILGGTFTTGTTEFSGAITLQHLTLPGVDNIRELTLTSESDDAGGGVLISGAIATADPGDVLSVNKQGSGTVTLTNAGTAYTGKTTVSAGTLAISGDTDISPTSWIEVASGATLDFSASNAGDFTFDGPVSGSGTVTTGTGSLIIGTDGGPGVMSPGMSSDPSAIGTAGDGIGVLTVNGNLELVGDSSGVNRLTLQMGATNGADYNDAANFSSHLGAGDFSSWITTQGGTYDAETGGDHDRLVVTGDFTLNSGGIISFTNNGGTDYQPVFGDVFNLIDWATLNPNSFSVGGNFRSGGLLGDLELPDLSLAGLFFETSLFSSHGIVVVVPEPSRVLLFLFGVIGLLLRRRR